MPQFSFGLNPVIRSHLDAIAHARCQSVNAILRSLVQDAHLTRAGIDAARTPLHRPGRHGFGSGNTIPHGCWCSPAEFARWEKLVQVAGHYVANGSATRAGSRLMRALIETAYLELAPSPGPLPGNVGENP